LEEHLAKGTLRNLRGKGLDDDDLAALAAYVRSLPLPTGHSTAPDDAAARGANVFRTAGCIGCHLPDHDYEDGVAHDIESRAPGDRFGDFRTPSLRAIAGAAPYFHDGRYATLGELLHGIGDTMGSTKNLSSEDLASLEAYLDTL
jgi:cytochrome c peroxidase